MRSKLEKRARSGSLISANETIRPSQCLGKRGCGACVGVSSAANKGGTGRSPATPGSQPATDDPGALQTSTGIQGCSREGARQGWVLATDVTCTHTFQDVFTSRATTFW